MLRMSQIQALSRLGELPLKFLESFTPASLSAEVGFATMRRYREVRREGLSRWLSAQACLQAAPLETPLSVAEVEF